MELEPRTPSIGTAIGVDVRGTVLIACPNNDLNIANYRYGHKITDPVRF
jgi:hypothetical protein